ncbi:MAG: hypothetical protein RL459_975 [Pseudomonadota bacterium]|jgi:HD-GYP domain-containing protein (c-di-GMP phosphodiesterase class II)
MNYVPLPIVRVQVGKPLPIDVWDGRGNLLLKKGQVIKSDEHREQLERHHPCAKPHDFKAWARSYDRLVYSMLRDGASTEEIARVPFPATILEVDYTVVQGIVGGWLDMQAVLHGLLYQGSAARLPVARLEALQARGMELINADPDACLFDLFQALADPQLSYCATHALLSATLCELTARKLGVPDIVRQVLFQAALVMNIGMAREQDALTRQNARPDAAQQQLIQAHPNISVDILLDFGLVNDDLIDIVRFHHDTNADLGLVRNLECRRILRAADVFVAKMAARANRVGLSAISATKDSIVGMPDEELHIAQAMAHVLGFYPPGTFVALANGERAVAVKRGPQANTPWVVSLVGATGLGLNPYVLRDTSDPAFAVQTPIRQDSLKVTVQPARVARALQGLQATKA